MAARLLTLALLLLACEDSSTGSIALFPGTPGAGGSDTLGESNGGSSGGRRTGVGGRAAGGTNTNGGASRGGSSAAGKGGATSCTTDDECAPPTPACSPIDHVCRICNKDSQCPSPLKCEIDEGHCE